MTLTIKRCFRKPQKGAVYIEFAMSALILMMLAIGVVSLGAKEIDVNRDNRVVWNALELATQLDEEIAFATPQDIDEFGKSIAAVSSFGATENYQLIVTVYDFNVAEEPSVRWQGTYGPASSNTTRLSSDLLGVYHEGRSYYGLPNERLIFIEMFRQRRGLGFNAGAGEPYYSSGVIMKEEP